MALICLLFVSQAAFAQTDPDPYNPPQAKDNLVYNGYYMDLYQNGTSLPDGESYTFYYRQNGGEWMEDRVLQAKYPGNYKIEWVAVPENGRIEEQTIKSITAKIDQKEAPQARKGLVYDPEKPDEQQYLIDPEHFGYVVGTDRYYWRYSDDEEWKPLTETDQPVGVKPGTYTIKYILWSRDIPEKIRKQFELTAVITSKDNGSFSVKYYKGEPVNNYETNSLRYADTIGDESATTGQVLEWLKANYTTLSFFETPVRTGLKVYVYKTWVYKPDEDLYQAVYAEGAMVAVYHPYYKDDQEIGFINETMYYPLPEGTTEPVPSEVIAWLEETVELPDDPITYNGKVLSFDRWSYNEEQNLYETLYTESIWNVTVRVSGHGSAAASPDSGVTGTIVTLTADPENGYHFREWQVASGGVVISDNSFTIGTSDVVILAVFERNQEPEPRPDWPGFFRVWPELPRTGITAAPGSVEKMTAASVSYTPVNMEMEIPTLGVAGRIVKVPLTDEGYPVTNLGMDAGLLEGFSLPGKGISIIAGHNTVNAEDYGPFANISRLEEGDLIFIRESGKNMLRFKVYSNIKIGPRDFESLRQAAEMYENSLTLLTCEDEMVGGGYASRRVISARPME